MRIIIKRNDFSTERGTLLINPGKLEFCGENSNISLLYRDIRELLISQDSNGKAYFYLYCTGQTYEGLILEPQQAEAFAEALKCKLGGVIHIDVRNN